MILNGKAKEKFLEWNEEQDAPISTYAIKQGLINEVILNALIIEFFDSVEIHICVTPVFPIYIYGWSYSINLDNCYDIFKTRQKATIQAIKKANDIYNERNEL